MQEYFYFYIFGNTISCFLLNIFGIGVYKRNLLLSLPCASIQFQYQYKYFTRRNHYAQSLHWILIDDFYISLINLINFICIYFSLVYTKLAIVIVCYTSFFIFALFIYILNAKNMKTCGFEFLVKKYKKKNNWITNFLVDPNNMILTRRLVVALEHNTIFVRLSCLVKKR